MKALVIIHTEYDYDESNTTIRRVFCVPNEFILEDDRTEAYKHLQHQGKIRLAKSGRPYINDLKAANQLYIESLGRRFEELSFDFLDDDCY